MFVGALVRFWRFAWNTRVETDEVCPHCKEKKVYREYRKSRYGNEYHCGGCGKYLGDLGEEWFGYFGEGEEPCLNCGSRATIEYDSHWSFQRHFGCKRCGKGFYIDRSDEQVRKEREEEERSRKFNNWYNNLSPEEQKRYRENPIGIGVYNPAALMRVKICP